MKPPLDSRNSLHSNNKPRPSSSKFNPSRFNNNTTTDMLSSSNHRRMDNTPNNINHEKKE